MKIHIYNSQKDLKISKKSTRVIVEALFDFFSLPHQEISIYFVSDKKMKKLHQEFFDDPTSTDCISFPLDEEHLGEIFICPYTAIQYAQKKHLDPYEETALYLIHGFLHCLGYDDLQPKLKRIMRKKEKTCMDLLKRLNIHLSP